MVAAPSTSIPLEAQFYALSLADRYLWKGAPSASPRFARQEALAQAVRERDGFVTPCEPRELPESDARDYDAFIEASDHYRRPVVLRGFARNTPAVQKWSQQHLTNALRGHSCMVYSQDHTSRTRSWDVGTHLVEMPFEEYMERGAKEHLYLNNLAVFEDHPELLADLQIDRIRKAFTTPGSTWDELFNNSIFVGAQHVFSPMHTGFAGNFFFQVAGRKRWVFVEPKYTAHMHAVTGRPFQFIKSAYGGSRTQQELGNQVHPVRMLPRFEVVLEPGDMLYNAPWWWHEVDNLDAFTVGCAVRHEILPTKATPSIRNNPAYALTSEYVKLRAVATAHYLKHCTLGNKSNLAELLTRYQQRGLEKGLGDRGRRAGDKTASSGRAG